MRYLLAPFHPRDDTVGYLLRLDVLMDTVIIPVSNEFQIERLLKIDVLFLDIFMIYFNIKMRLFKNVATKIFLLGRIDYCVPIFFISIS